MPILPLTFISPDDYQSLPMGTNISFPDIYEQIRSGASEIALKVEGETILTQLDVSPCQRQHLLAGGTLNQVKQELG